jgi:hypothetical protein
MKHDFYRVSQKNSGQNEELHSYWRHIKAVWGKKCRNSRNILQCHHLSMYESLSARRHPTGVPTLSTCFLTCPDISRHIDDNALTIVRQRSHRSLTLVRRKMFLTYPLRKSQTVSNPEIEGATEWSHLDRSIEEFSDMCPKMLWCPILKKEVSIRYFWQSVADKTPSTSHCFSWEKNVPIASALINPLLRAIQFMFPHNMSILISVNATITAVNFRRGKGKFVPVVN